MGPYRVSSIVGKGSIYLETLDGDEFELPVNGILLKHYFPPIVRVLSFLVGQSRQNLNRPFQAVVQLVSLAPCCFFLKLVVQSFQFRFQSQNIFFPCKIKIKIFLKSCGYILDLFSAFQFHAFLFFSILFYPHMVLVTGL